ncbi:MAG: alpha/beta fold hydrolase [Ilumatobacter sp.]
MPSSDVSARHTAIAERLIDGRNAVGSVAVAPDANHVAFVVSTADLSTNVTISRIWLDDVPLTDGHRDLHPTWSPDGRFLAYAAQLDPLSKERTLHIVPVDAPGETRTIATMPDGLTDLAWSPDGSTIAFISRARDERYTQPDASWQSPRKVEKFFSRLNGENWVFDRPKHLYVVEANGTSAPRDLTPGAHEHSSPTWAPDSSGLVVSAQRHDNWDLDLAVDLYFVPIDADTNPGSVRCLTAHDGSYEFPSISHDGNRVAFIGHGELETLAQNSHVGVIPFGSVNLGIDQVTWASGALDRTFMCMAGTRAPLWNSDGSLLATAEDRGDNHLYRVPGDGSHAPEALSSGPVTVHSFDAAGTTIATTRSTIDRTAELFVNDARITDLGGRLAPSLLPWEKFLARTTDASADIDAWIMRPANFDASRTYPVLLNVHGGPFTQYGEYFFDEAQMQAAAGFVVVLGNPRGGSGREEAWGQAIQGPKHPVRPGTGWGSVDVDDVLAILDTALDRYSFCDPDRVGMLGGSYGGFMATWLAGHHGERFRAFCSERAVNNLVSEEWNSDIGTAFRTEHGPLYIDDVEVYEASSPIASIRNIDTPMLIIHSEEDWRCPIGQAEELWMGLKLLGKEVDFYRFPGEDHELSRSGSVVHRVQRAEIILDWFSDKLAPR